MSYDGKYNAARYPDATMQCSPVPSTSAPMNVKQQESLAAVLDHGRNNEERLREVLGRVSSFADVLLGQHPAEANCGAPEPMPMGVVGALDASTVSVERLISQVYIQLDRIHVAIGG